MVIAKKGNAHKTLRSKFCSCIKSVRRTVNRRTSKGAAIAICVRSVLGSRGKTLHHFTCKKKETLKTQAFFRSDN